MAAPCPMTRLRSGCMWHEGWWIDPGDNLREGLINYPGEGSGQPHLIELRPWGDSDPQDAQRDVHRVSGDSATGGPIVFTLPMVCWQPCLPSQSSRRGLWSEKFWRFVQSRCASRGK